MNWDLIKIKNLSFAKDPVERMKKKTTNWEKIFGNYISNKGLTSKQNIKICQHSTVKNNPIRKQAFLHEIHEKTFHHRGNIDGK